MKAFARSPYLFYGLLGIGLALPLTYFYRFYTKKEKKEKKATSSITVIADIGGTNSRFQLVEIDPTMEEPKLLFSKNYSTKAYDTFHAVLHQFLEDSKLSAPRYPNNAVLAVAGPVKNNTVTASNVKKWGELNGYTLKKEFNLDSCTFLNDFEAIAYAVLKLQQKDLIAVNDGVQPIENEKIAILGPGTGLGYCTIVPAAYNKGWRYYVWGGEGGHAAFSPIDLVQSQYMLWLMEKLNLTYLCTEKAFAGPGIKPIYEFLHEKVHTDLEYNQSLSTEEIVEKGVKNQDPLCRKVVDFFLDLYSTEIGNMVCREKPLSGIYLVGSLTNAVKDYLINERKAEFLKMYHNKDLMRPLVEKVPIFIVTKDNLGLLGAFCEAQRALI